MYSPDLQTSAELHRNHLLIVVISTMSSLPSAVKNFVFQAAVPKVRELSSFVRQGNGIEL